MGFFHRLKHSRLISWVADKWWRFKEALFNWWHPPSDDPYPNYGYYGRSRASRLSRAWRRLRHRISRSWLSDFLSGMLFRLQSWWYPPAQDAQAGYGYYGSSRRSRFATARRRWGRRLWQSAFGRWWGKIYARLYEWWYPVSNDPGSYGGYYGNRRRNRLAIARRRWGRWLRQSAFGRWCGEIYDRLYEWWFPVSDDAGRYVGYYGRTRKSRPVLAWRKFERRVRNSWLGKRYREYLDRFFVWWYPPCQDFDGHYPHYGRRQVSRPVLALRRWNRWFRKTWVGREFGWILDEVAFLLDFAQFELAQAVSRRRIERFLSRKQNIAVLVALVLTAAAGYRYGRPYYLHYVEEQYARQAEQFIMKGDFARAYLRARQVMQINPDNAAACRVNAELADWANSPFALYWRRRTMLLEPSPTNRLALASTALKAEPFPYPTAAKALDEMEPDFRRTASYHLVAGALAIKLNHLSEAEEHYAEARKLQPDNPVTRMSLAVVQLQSKDPKMVSDSRITLELLNTDGKLGILPLRSLVAESVARRDFARAEQLSQQVLTNARASFGDRMLHLSILHAAGRTNFQRFLKETQQKAVQHPVYIGELAAWLNQFGFASEALTWLHEPPRQVSSQGLIPLALADSYVALEKWKELETYLESQHWIGQEHIRIAMLALAMRKQSGDHGSVLVWNRATRLASDSPTALNMLVQLALNWGWKAEAEQVLWQATARFPKQPWPLASLQNLYLAQRDTAGLRRVYQASMQRDPKDKLAKNNFTMLSLLSGKDLPTAHKYAAELSVGEPGNPVFASTYAFSLHLQGKTKEGVGVLRALKPEELANPAVAVYYGVLLSAVGEVQASKDYLDKAKTAYLLPEEMALATSARKVN
jgi:Flp pilus assembly protein TadD